MLPPKIDDPKPPTSMESSLFDDNQGQNNIDIEIQRSVTNTMKQIQENIDKHLRNYEAHNKHRKEDLAA